MNYEQFKNIYDVFISKNAELVSQYENACNESVEEYVEEIYQSILPLIKKNSSLSLFNILKTALTNSIKQKCSLFDSIDSITTSSSIDLSDLSSTERYFKEVNDIYVKNNNDYDIVYSPENRDKLIQMNLKTVISIAKRYMGLGLSLEDLIGAGNEGLCVAYDKYKPEKAKLKDNMLDVVESLPEEVSSGELYDAVSRFISYGSVREKFMETFLPNNVYNKEVVKRWINKNVRNAKFNSVATMWIRAYIINSINGESRIVRKPKAEIFKDVAENGSYSKEVTVDIDAPINDDSNSTLGDIINLDDDHLSDMEVQEAYDTYKKNLKILLTGVKSRDRSIFLKKFGIGLPRPILPKEIAEQEGLSIARVSQIFQIVEQQIQQNAIKYNVNIEELFDVARKLR